MRKRPLTQTGAVILLCWLATAGAMLLLWRDTRQQTFAGENEHWRATYSCPDFPLGQPPPEGRDQGMLVLTYTGDRAAYRSCEKIWFRCRRLDAETTREMLLEDGERLPLHISARTQVHWTEPMLEQVTVDVALDDGPAEQIVLTRR